MERMYSAADAILRCASLLVIGNMGEVRIFHIAVGE